MSDARTIFLYRLVGQRRVRFRFDIDDDDVIISEKVDVVKAVVATDAREQSLIDRGITFQRQGQRLLIESVPAAEQQILGFFTEKPRCWFEGCEELHREYSDEVASLGGSECTNCDKGKIIQKFRKRLEALLHAQKKDHNTRA